MLAFDIETGPWEESPAEFDESTVSYGNTKDPEKRKKKLEEERAKWEGRATLDATRCKIIGLGLCDGDTVEVNLGDEVSILQNWWIVYEEHRRNGPASLVGHNVRGFDLDMIYKRSRIHGIKIPFHFESYRKTKNMWYSGAEVWDTMWDGWRDWIKLDVLARLLGFDWEKKFKGEMFWQVLQEDQDRAVEYLQEDCRAVWEIATYWGKGVQDSNNMRRSV